MKAIDVIRMALQMTDESTAALAADMRDAPLTRPISRDGNSSGNHPLWILGHLAFIEGSIPGILLGPEKGGPNPVERWAHLFATGTEPKDDPGLYPSFDEVLSALRSQRARTLQLLEEVGDAGLDRVPIAPPPALADAMTTFGQAFMLLALHQMVHYGQVADARRVAGVKPPF
jgi:hypothetical protein